MDPRSLPLQKRGRIGGGRLGRAEAASKPAVSNSAMSGPLRRCCIIVKQVLRTMPSSHGRASSLRSESM
jgi:hypothetical protein